MAQFNTPVLDGVIAGGEYGTHVDGANQQSATGTTWYMTWDNTNLYVAFSGSNYNEGGVIYLDINPIVPVNGGAGADGSTQGFYNWDEDHALLPFRADFVLYFKNGYSQFRYPDGMGYYGGPNENLLIQAGNGGTNTLEIAIPWNTITQGAGRPAQFNWLGYRVYVNNPTDHGVYGQIPTNNPGCSPCANPVSTTYHALYYNVLNTNSGSSTLPFSTQSLTYHEDFSPSGIGGYYLGNYTLYDLTVNDTNSTDNSDNDVGNWGYNNAEISNRVLVGGSVVIQHDLYVGQGSAILPADNNPLTVVATLVFTGTNGTVYNFGRIDSNPESLSTSDMSDRRMEMHFGGITTIAASPLNKDHWRMGNVQVQSGATLQAPASGTASIELNYATMINGGTINFGDGSAGTVDLGLRGDMGYARENLIFTTTPTAEFILYNFLIGRDTAVVRGGPGPLPAVLQINGNFENYGGFIPFSGSGRIDVVMTGSQRQEIRGNITETQNATTTFHNLEINNNNGAGNNNAGADVHFVSFGGGEIEYVLTGELTLSAGDLITRDRVTSLVHNFTLADTATVDFSGATHDVGGIPSCFVDGPLRYEVADAGMVTRDFPVGKTYTATGVEIGDYRHLNLELDHTTATRTTYTVEMFGDDRSTFYTWPAPVMGEVIGSISEQRYWNVTPDAGGSPLDSAFITLDYHTLERTDDVTSAPTLRIVKDNGVGDWVNIAPLIPGGTAPFIGNVRSKSFTSFSDFTLADLITGNLPLPLSFEATLINDRVALDWQAPGRDGTHFYEVFRSTDGSNFEFLHREYARGNTGMLNYRTFDTDIDPSDERYYYRLRSVDLDGAANWTSARIVHLSLSGGAKLYLYPNPNSGHFTLGFESFPQDSPVELNVFNELGQKLHAETLTFTSDFYQYPLYFRLPQGIYLLEIRNRSLREVRTFWVE